MRWRYTRVVCVCLECVCGELVGKSADRDCRWGSGCTYAMWGTGGKMCGGGGVWRGSGGECWWGGERAGRGSTGKCAVWGMGCGGVGRWGCVVGVCVECVGGEVLLGLPWTVVTIVASPSWSAPTKCSSKSSPDASATTVNRDTSFPRSSVLSDPSARPTVDMIFVVRRMQELARRMNTPAVHVLYRPHQLL